MTQSIQSTQSILLAVDDKKFINLKGASLWASHHLAREVTVSNISYLLQYGRIKKYGSNGSPLVKIKELKDYYDAYDREKQWQREADKDLNWQLSFAQYKESETTKHVHRLHPYKGKFIPQLVEYFLDPHTDAFKQESYFNEGDIVLDPFCGSGTTLIQANELGLHAIGIDVSAFNAIISNAKVGTYNISRIKDIIHSLTSSLETFQQEKNNIAFQEHLSVELAKFNHQYFPSPEYKRKLRAGKIDEKRYANDKEQEFLHIYSSLVEKYQIKIKQDSDKSFLDKWFLLPVREEIDFMSKALEQWDDKEVKKLLAIILSRTVRSCRATTHADLGTLKEPITTSYYCKKHGKICKPLFSIKGWWERYTIDSLNRLAAFDELKTDTVQTCLIGDAKTIDVNQSIKVRNPDFYKVLSRQKIKGIFSSPPYVGLIDYHQQHAYSYEIFGLKRQDELEIGALTSGQGKKARDSYSLGVAEVLKNCKKYLQKDYDIFLVANDKFNLYPEIAQSSGMKIVNRFKRPVLNRVEKDRLSNAYTETIFHLKEK